jgi:hypothetical protein
MKKIAQRAIASFLMAMLVLSAMPVALAVDASLEEKPFTAEELADIQNTNEAIEEYINSLYNNTVLRQSPNRGVYLEVPEIKQDNGYYCGPASALMVAKYLKIVDASFTQTNMAKALGTTKDGSSSTNIVSTLNNQLSAAGKAGRYQVANTSVTNFNRSISYTLDKGYPMIMNVDKMPLYLESTGGHFIVIRGYTSENYQKKGVEYVTINDCYNDTRYFGKFTYSYKQIEDACNSNVGNYIRLK